MIHDSCNVAIDGEDIDHNKVNNVYDCDSDVDDSSVTDLTCIMIMTMLLLNVCLI